MFALALAGCASVPPPAVCTMDPADRAWLEAALLRWEHASGSWLRLAHEPLPTVLTADRHCAYTLTGGEFGQMSALPHNGATFPAGGADLPLGPVSFADGPDRFVMTLPSVWRAAGVTSEVGLEQLMQGVLLHEIMHTRQAGLAAQSLASIEQRSGLGGDLSDDNIQEHFAEDTAYRAAYEAERDLLFAAAAAPTDAEARTLARTALHSLRDRRARFFTGPNGWLEDADDVFLSMEGTGQWLIYRDLVAADGPALGAPEALVAVRRGGRFWSQDEGLALMLVVDRLLPDWKARAFREPDWRAERMLAAAVGDE